ncbi:MAG TPA: DUF808 domain-containing protein, partial [Polyangiaceae bacterium]|nr:DUF808 domain-containing protein [Polyangiaceae bacterium]
MATSLLALLDDISTVLDDVALLTKVAAKKSTGVLGDDLALNAEQVSGVRADRELPVVWAVAKGSLKNKAILVPAALLIQWVAPWLISPLLMAGGTFLCFEGAEKIAHQFLSRQQDKPSPIERMQSRLSLSQDITAMEKAKIKGAIRTDFVLSAEIVVITMGTVADASIWTSLSVLSGVAVLMTVGVYGVVAVIVKLDDAGRYLSERTGEGVVLGAVRWIGFTVLRLAPYLMKTLTIVGTAAMFLVGGGIIVHGISAVHSFVQFAKDSLGTVFAPILEPLLQGLMGVLVGMVALLL